MSTCRILWSAALISLAACTPPADAPGTRESSEEAVTARPLEAEPLDEGAAIPGVYRMIVESARGPIGLFPAEENFEGAVYELTSPEPGLVVVLATTAQGILSAEQRVTLGSDGRVVRRETLGRWGEPLGTRTWQWLNGSTAIVDAVRRDGTNPSAPCRRIREAYAHGPDGDFLTTETCLDGDGAPRPDEAGCVGIGYSRYGGERRGLVQARTCLGPDRAATGDVEGIARTVYSRDAAGCVRSRSYKSAAGRPAPNGDGIAVARFDRTATCVATATTLFGVDGKAAAGSSGVHRFVYEIAHDLATSERRYDVRGRPVRSRADGAHLVRNTYNESGDKLESRLFGTDERPIDGRLGHHMTRSAYTAEGLLKTTVQTDVKARLVRRPSTGAFQEIAEWDATGDLVSLTFLDARGRPMKDSNHQVERLRITRDSAGRVVEQSYWSAQGAPVARWSGSHASRDRYDARGRMISSETLDIEGRPVVDDLGKDREVFAYDDADRLVESSAFRGAEPATIGGDSCIRGEHRIQRELDWRGRVTALRYFGPAGEAVDASLCVPEVAAHRIDFVYEGARCVEQRYFSGESAEPVLVRDCRKQECVSQAGKNTVRD